MMKIGIVGHRFFNNVSINNYVKLQFEEFFKYCTSNYSNLLAISAIAEGADSIFAEVALSFSIPLEIIIPFRNYIEDFANPVAKNKYLNITALAQNVICLNFSERSVDAYFAAMKHIVFESEILLAVWDGKPSNGRGGTAEAVGLAIKTNTTLLHININNLTTKVYKKNNLFLLNY